MANLKLNIDVEKLASMFKEFKMEVEQDLTKAVENLAAITHAKVLQMAEEELDTSFAAFKDSVGFEEVADGIWVVSISEKGIWVEEGIAPNTDMKPGLLKNPDGITKDGYKYKVIPFDHGKPPSQMTPVAQTLVSQLKQKLKAENIPFKKIETNPDGTPKLGKLHQFTRLGGDYPTAKAKRPGLDGLSIYQTMQPNGKVKRDLFTFRTVSSGPSSTGKWIHPGFEAKKFLDRAMEWAVGTWEREILPEITKKWDR